MTLPMICPYSYADIELDNKNQSIIELISTQFSTRQQVDHHENYNDFLYTHRIITSVDYSENSNNSISNGLFEGNEVDFDLSLGIIYKQSKKIRVKVSSVNKFKPKRVL